MFVLIYDQLNASNVHIGKTILRACVLGMGVFEEKACSGIHVLQQSVVEFTTQ